MDDRVRFKCQKCGREVLLPLFNEPLNCCGQKMVVVPNKTCLDKKIDKIKDSKTEKEIKSEK